LDVEDLGVSLAFYRDVCGFHVLYERPAERFAYLALDGAELMLEEAGGPGRRFHTAPLEKPYGRGINLQIVVAAVRPIYERVLQAKARLVLDIEERWYRLDDQEGGNRQFVVADPDGYLLRFFQDLGRRPAA